MPDIAGLKLIVPTSVAATGAGSSASVSASGKVTFSTAGTLSVNGCFSASYDNYLIVMRHLGSTTTGLYLRLRAAGVDATTNYTSQYVYANNTTVAGGRETPTHFRFLDISETQRSGDHIYLYGPHLSQATAARNVGVSGWSNAYIFDNAGTHSTASSYDGFTITIGSPQTFTGALCIYGLSQ